MSITLATGLRLLADSATRIGVTTSYDAIFMGLFGVIGILGGVCHWYSDTDDAKNPIED